MNTQAVWTDVVSQMIEQEGGRVVAHAQDGTTDASWQVEVGERQGALAMTWEEGNPRRWLRARRQVIRLVDELYDD